MSGTIICIPTFDEIDNLGPLVAGIREAAPDVHLLVIDDASPDGTGELADAIAAEDAHVHVLHRSGKQGLGRAYLAGFAYALEHGYDVVVEMDADGSHRAVDLPALLDGLEDADVVLGSRWIAGGRVSGWPLRRQLLSRAGNLYARLLLMLPVRDATGGFRAYRAATLRQLGLDTVRSDGYCFQVELVHRAIESGAVVHEVPITFLERRAGTSKMSGRIVVEALLRIAVLALAGPAVRPGAVAGPLQPAEQR
ncbi:polyprenol monophosphomannose synthase [Amnibacterium kyonggiense]|uniref:Dolichol-phosphate mannosyltransferase n=1 Tax=Amnibacterium kyonggiense TaxID=595671 RepID=A0A4V3EB90_9MICO|nr:polyprenol monophosphomannose synthase [Amnibacterium kyonggiense]TDS80774.1 dolichol-phosphate mannosyltransferase [Amnibacterium kyonggiense]